MAKRIVILGAGVAGAAAIKSVHKHFHSQKNVSITIIDKQNHTTFVPMIHEVATGSVNAYDITHPIRELISCCLDHFHQSEIQGIDLEQKEVKTSDGIIPYDYLVIALGSTTNFFGVTGASENAITLKTLRDALKLRGHLIDTFEKVSKLSIDAEHRRDALHFVLIGAGYTGVETAGQIADLFQKEFRRLYPEITPDEPKITIVQGSDRILPILNESSSMKVHKRLEKLGVNILTGVRAIAITQEGVSLNNGEILKSHNVIWTSGVLARGAEYFLEDQLEKGRIKVRSTLQTPNHPEVFVIGDIAGVTEGGGPHPQTAQAAVQQAAIIGPNIKALINSEPLTPFNYSHKGDLVPVGNRWAVAEIKGIKFSGFVAWWLRRTVYLQGITNWGDRFRVMFDWTMNLFSKRDTTRL